MNRSIKSYLYIIVILLISAGCRQAKYVQEGHYLLKSNEIFFEKEKNDEIKLEGDHPQIDESGLEELIRPVPNRSLKLFFYNRIDSTRLNKQVEKRESKYRAKNEKRQAKEDRINLERIAEAEELGDSLYRHKVIPKKSVKLGWRNWIRTNLGQGPILLDTFKVGKSAEQMRIYLNKRGFYSAEVKDTVILNEKHRKAKVQFIINPGEPYVIRNFALDTASFTLSMRQGYDEMVTLEGVMIEPGKLLDEGVLDAERDRFTKYCRNEKAMLGFNRNYVGFVVDTTVGNLQADVLLYVKQKTIKDPTDTTGKTLIEIEHLVYRVRDVTFILHNTDTASFKNYKEYRRKCALLGLTVDELRGEYPLLDTMRIYGKGTFIYNEVPYVDPDLLDKQNFLEISRNHKDSIKYYKEYYVERSYRTLNSLGVFAIITPTVVVDPAAPLDRWVVVTYDLTPLERQSFLFEPSLKNTNGILGIQGTMSYTNRNLLRGAQELKISFVGGMESQPLIVGTETDNRTFKLNTFEWGPKVSYSLPRLVPLPKRFAAGLSKRAYPRTIFDLNINSQRRVEFKRALFELGYQWMVSIPKTQILTIKFAQLNFVRLIKEDFFEENLLALDDPFLINSYADHFSTITNVTWSYSNLNRNERTKNNFHNLSVDVDFSGIEVWKMSLLTPLIYKGLDAVNFTGVGENANGLREFFGVPYTQFVKFDIQYVGSFEINRKHHFVYRTMAGVGFAWGNSPSLPYEQAFFAGGSNDIRAFLARTMAPGSYKTYADTNSTTTQIGDSRFEVNVEWRFEMTEMLEGAFFVDAGNIWNLRRDTMDVDDPRVLKPSSYKEIAIGVGYGVRADFDFLIVRLDLSFALHNPHMPAGERWWLSDKTGYESYFPLVNGELKGYESPHLLRFNFAIGYPF